MAMIALAQQSAQQENNGADTPMLLSQGVPQFADTLPENVSPEGSFSCCEIPAECQGIPAVEMSWFGE